ncbi:heat shock 22 kDa protein, mitochondrial-like [Cornus florida]|uniref:heat shock 22 kDa protein, mitochondrial-like n=1 Tax=Cornus florida TaxID=4283 RepID=UPI0028A12BCD|nr:heat shock 22 kDa protein, mitochondrial-like [Cornus florida]
MASSRALTTATSLLMLLRSRLTPQMATPFAARALRTVTALPTSDFTKLRRSDLSPQMLTPFAARSLRTFPVPTSGSDSHDSDSDSDPFDDISFKRCSKILRECPYKNRLLRKGSVDSLDVKEDEEAKYGRFDMPGIGKEEAKVWVEKGALIVTGDEASGSETARSYFAAIELAEGRFVVDQIKAELKNGVLNVVIPKVKFEERSDVLPIEVN